MTNGLGCWRTVQSRRPIFVAENDSLRITKWPPHHCTGLSTCHRGRQGAERLFTRERLPQGGGSEAEGGIGNVGAKAYRAVATRRNSAAGKLSIVSQRIL